MRASGFELAVDPNLALPHVGQHLNAAPLRAVGAEDAAVRQDGALACAQENLAAHVDRAAGAQGSGVPDQGAGDADAPGRAQYGTQVGRLAISGEGHAHSGRAGIQQLHGLSRGQDDFTIRRGDRAFVADLRAHQDHLAATGGGDDALIEDAADVGCGLEVEAAGEEVGVAHPEAAGDEGGSIDRARGADEDSSGIDQPDLAVGLELAVDQAGVGAQHAVEYAAAGGRLHELHEFMGIDAELLPVEYAPGGIGRDRHGVAHGRDAGDAHDWLGTTGKRPGAAAGGEQAHGKGCQHNPHTAAPATRPGRFGRGNPGTMRAIPDQAVDMIHDVLRLEIGGDVHGVDLFRAQVLFRIAPIDPGSQEETEQIRVDMLILLEEHQDLDGLRERLGLLVGPVGRRQRLENIGDGHDARGHRQVILGQSARIAGADQRFVVRAGIFGHALQVVREGQVFQHRDGLDDVFVDLEALLVGQCAPAYAQVVHLAVVVEIFRHIELESVFRVERLLFFPRQDVVGHVGQQRFSRREFCHGLTLVAAQLLLRQAETVVEMAQPVHAGDAPQAFDAFRSHELPAQVAFRHEGEVVDQRCLARRKRLIRVLRRHPACDGFEPLDLGIPEENFETRADFMDAVVDGFQLGGLVDHIFRRRDLATVVQPGADAEFAPFVVRLEAEVGQNAVLHLAGFLGQHHGQFRHAFAMPSGIGTFRVDGASDEPDQGVHQLPLGFDQLAVLQRHRRLRRQRFDEADDVPGERHDFTGIRILGIEQLDHALDLALPG